MTRATLRSTLLPMSLGVIVSLAGVWLVARDVDAAQIGLAFDRADAGWILAGLAAIGATFVVRAWRWSTLLRPLQYRGLTVMAAMLVGQSLNFLLPFRAGDLARSAALGRAPGSSFERVLGSVAVEKLWDWLALTGLALLVALIVPLPAWLDGPARSFGLVAVVLLAGARLALAHRLVAIRWLDRLFRRAPERWRRFVAQRLDRLLDGMESLRRRDAAGRAAVATALTWLLGVVVNAAILRAYGVDSWSAAMLLMVVLMAGVALPPSIAALGLFEALTVLTLSLFGVPGETALAVGVTLHVVIFVPPIVIGALLAAWERRQGRRPAPATAPPGLDRASRD